MNRTNYPAAVFTLFLSLVSSIAQATPNDLRFKHLTVQDGLSQGSVNAIAEDRHGFIWLGTQQGLNRYDGIEFKTFLHDAKDPRSLPSDWVWNLFLDSHERLWVGMRKGGLASFDGEGFTPHAPEVRSVRHVVEDHQGILWLAADEQGLVRYDPQTETATISTPSQLHPDAVNVKTLHHDPYGTLWVGTTGAGLLRFDPLLDRAEQTLELDEADTVRSIVGGGEQLLWVATDESGTFSINAATGVIEHALEAEDNNQVRVLFLGGNEHLWLGHEVYGLSRRTPDGQLTRYAHDPARATSIANEHVRAIYEDRNQIVWVGTQRGVSLWNPLSAQFSTFSRKNTPGSGSLSGDWIANFAEHTPNKYWVATYGEGLNLVDAASGEVTVYRAEPDDVQSLADDRVTSVLEDSRGQVWAGLLESGLSRLDLSTETWRHYRASGDTGSISHNVITSLAEDHENRLWIGTLGGGLNVYVPETDTFRSFRHDSANSQSLCSDRVLALYEDRAKVLWVSTYDGGICRYDPNTNGFVSYLHDAENPRSLSSNVAWMISEDTAGNLWVGTDSSGLNVWLHEDRKTDTSVFHRFDVSNGMKSNVVYGMASDRLGYTWVGSNLGLTRYGLTVEGERAELTNVRHLTVDDGLPGNEFNFSAALQTSNGQLLFGGTGGFVSFHPAKLPNSALPPEVVLTEFYLLEEAQAFSPDSLRFDIEYADRLIRFEYAALSFYAPNKIQYQHMLAGFDEDWVDDGRESKMTYTNLTPGAYEFQVRAREGSGPWGPPLVVTLDVASPWWSTWTAYVAYSLALLLTALVAYRIWSRRVEAALALDAMNRSLLREVREREAKELALEQQRRRTQRYLDVVEVLIVALDAHGQVTMLNQKGARLLGLDEVDALGTRFVEAFVPVSDQVRVNSLLENVEEYAYSEWRIGSVDGVERLMAWHSVKLPQEGTEPAGVLLSGSDVTQMRNLESQLREGQKMEALGTLARGVAHDFNNVLSAILGYAELARDGLAKGGDAKEPLDKLEDSVSQAKSIVGNVLAFGKASQVPAELVDFSTVVSDALMLVRPIVPANVRLSETLEMNVGPVFANSAQVIQIILNLSTNACQSMAKKGGTLALSLTQELMDVEQARQFGSLQPGLYARLVIEDSGPGMDSYTQGRMFEPFFTTRPTGEGNGLGLSVVHGVVSSMNGHIHVESELDRGTVFSIYFPCSSEAIPVDAEEVREVQTETGDEIVLLVDDEESVLEVTARRLESFGYKVLSAQNGADAMAVVEDARQRVDVIVTDQSMPDIRGEDLAQSAKQIRPLLPVILMSGADHTESEFIDGFVSKPFTGQVLAIEIRGQLDSESTQAGSQ